MPGSHAEEIVGDYYESDDWAESFAGGRRVRAGSRPAATASASSRSGLRRGRSRRPARCRSVAPVNPWWLRVGEHGDGHSDLGEVVGRASDGERLADATVRGGIRRNHRIFVKGDAADERHRPRQPLAERRRPPALDLGVDAVTSRRRRCRGLARRDGDRPHDAIAGDQQCDLAVEQDLGALCRRDVRDRRGTDGASPAALPSAYRAAPSGSVAPTSGTRARRSSSRARGGRLHHL